MRQPDHLHLSNSLQTPETFTSLLAALLIKEENTKNFLSGNNSETPKRSFSLRMAMADCSLSVSFFFIFTLKESCPCLCWELSWSNTQRELHLGLW